MVYTYGYVAFVGRARLGQAKVNGILVLVVYTTGPGCTQTRGPPAWRTRPRPRPRPPPNHAILRAVVPFAPPIFHLAIPSQSIHPGPTPPASLVSLCDRRALLALFFWLDFDSSVCSVRTYVLRTLHYTTLHALRPLACIWLYIRTCILCAALFCSALFLCPVVPCFLASSFLSPLFVADTHREESERARERE